MIGYVCKYTPVEVLEAMGAEPVRIDPSVADFDLADTLMHPNVCSYVKGVLEDVAGKNYEGVVLTTCCDSVRRLADVLRRRYPERFLWLLDVPRLTTGTAAELYADRIREMAEAYAAFSGRPFQEEKLREILCCRASEHRRNTRASTGRLRVGLMGARCGNGLRVLLDECGADVAFDMTCTGAERRLPPPEEGDGLLKGYAASLLRQLPCLRMADVSARERRLREAEGRLDGIVYHTVKFCDSYSYEYAVLRGQTKLPILKVETDTTRQCEGQLRTRVEAFLESLSAEKNSRPLRRTAGNGGEKNVIVIGIDSGSTSTNAAVMNGKKEILASGSVRTGAKTGVSAESILDGMLRKAGLERQDVSLIVSTGYGRVSIPFADRTVTEISCHGRGALYFNPGVRTILDIGGQDSKAIRLNDKGEVADFVMNDKCAAGTGRFLEAMARTLEIGIDELGPVSLRSEKAVEISSMCTVFAESEVISLIAQNCEKADIANGVHRAIAGKAYSLLSRVGFEPEYMMTGGVARNPGVVKAVEERLGAKLFLCEDPEIVGAVGAALFGLESLGVD